MEAKRVLGVPSRSKLSLCLTLFWILASPIIIIGFASRGRNGFNENLLQEVSRVNLSVQDGRPVAKAISLLEAKYGWIITYEDPRYSYADDIEDVTEKVRRDLNKYPKGAAPKVLVPKEGTLSFDYNVMSQTNVSPDPVVIVRQLLAAQAASANAGKFRMEKGDNIIHVIPTAIKDKSGRLTPQKSVLDIVVTLPAKERTGLETLQTLCAAISTAAHVRVVVGIVPIGLFLQHKDQYGTAGRKAREVLVQLFERVGKGMRLSWQLFYDPGLRMYALNIHVV
jgi:hypothetical protein